MIGNIFSFLGLRRRKRRQLPNKQQLDRMLSVHLSFEINRFGIGVDFWRRKVKGEVEIEDMLLEACLIHMRLLLDFFFPPRKAELFGPHNDIFVTDYIPKAQWSAKLKFLLQRPQWLQRYRDKLNWQLAHLTTRRIDVETEYPWHHWKDIEQPFRHLEQLIEEFLRELPPDQRGLYDWRRGYPGAHSSPPF